MFIRLPLNNKKITRTRQCKAFPEQCFRAIGQNFGWGQNFAWKKNKKSKMSGSEF